MIRAVLGDRDAPGRDTATGSERQFETLANLAPAGIFRTDTAGQCTYVNQAWLRITGIAPDAWQGNGWARALHPEDAKRIFEGWAAAVAERRVYRDEFRWLRDTGEAVWTDVSAGPEIAEDGSVLGFIGVTMDVTARKEMEAQLQVARISAEQSAHAKAAFLANMSHEIRTPMNGVLGFTELLSQSSLDDEQRQQVQLIAESGRAMMRLLNDVLDLSKIESGKMRVDSETVDLGHALRGCARLMEPIALAKGVDLIVDIDSALPRYIVSDRFRVRQIALNLIGNAVKFTARGSVTVRAHAVGGHLAIDVVDTGIGISPDRIEAIFQQFAQADRSTAGRYGGSGLGLSISAELARLLGGAIDVRSTVGTGSTFTLSLPLVEAALPPEPAVTPDGPAIIAAPGLADQPKVLIAEDHDINQTLILALARRAGFAPVLAVNGAEAVDLVVAAAAANEPFDLVLMDMQMPEMDGLEATRRIRAAGFAPQTLPIVALTANAYAEDIAACLAAGMQSHLAKPVHLGDLAGLAQHYLRPLDRVEAPPASPAPAATSVLERYRARKLETLNAISAAVRSADLGGATLADLAGMLHKLAGTAGFFGETDLGQIAASLEHELLAAAAPDQAALLRDGLRRLTDAA